MATLSHLAHVDKESLQRSPHCSASRLHCFPCRYFAMHYWGRTIPCEGAWGNIVNPFNFMGLLSRKRCPRIYSELRGKVSNAFPNSKTLQRSELALIDDCELWNEMSRAQCKCNGPGEQLRLVRGSNKTTRDMVVAFQVDNTTTTHTYASKTAECGKRRYIVSKRFLLRFITQLCI